MDETEERGTYNGGVSGDAEETAQGQAPAKLDHAKAIKVIAFKLDEVLGNMTVLAEAIKERDEVIAALTERLNALTDQMSELGRQVAEASAFPV
ncbi:hypothetical protein RZS08_63860, partial [Arthrospira platensis SPKY1]|nr:hypothetical protein [Arthrospira platensis SPKY1]